jgi:hypothetical protein
MLDVRPLGHTMSNRYTSIFLSLLIAATLTACSRAPKPDRYPASTKVTLTMRMVSPDPFQLGPHSSQLFLDMLTNQPVHSEISQMPALPMGTFTVGGTQYLWHGNGVIRGKGSEELLWHGPYLQRLITVVMREEHANRESVQRILDALEQDSTVASTPLQGPGQYPGGANDALHPAQLIVGDTNGWGVFTPETNKP